LPTVGGETIYKTWDETAPATAEAQKWQGWGTALKPAFEPVVVARKPLIGTVAENVLAYGTGGLNIDATRIGTETRTMTHAGTRQGSVTSGASQGGQSGGFNFGSDNSAITVSGRWPSNVMLDEFTAGLVDEQSGERPGGTFPAKRGQSVNTSFASGQETLGGQRSMGDSGGASRFFYVAKASKRDRNEGLDELPVKNRYKKGRVGGTGGKRDVTVAENATPVQNFHPTVKPTDLMRQLVRLVTPPGGVVLDPFTGSGSTGKAAILEGFEFIGVELTDEYLPIIEGRLLHAVTQRAQAQSDAVVAEAETLF